VLGEPPNLVLAPDLFPIDVDVENAARPLDHLGIHVELLLNRGRQTGGCGVVVSLHAVLDADVHVASQVGSQPYKLVISQSRDPQEHALRVV